MATTSCNIRGAQSKTMFAVLLTLLCVTNMVSASFWHTESVGMVQSRKDLWGMKSSAVLERQGRSLEELIESLRAGGPDDADDDDEENEEEEEGEEADDDGDDYDEDEDEDEDEEEEEDDGEEEEGNEEEVEEGEEEADVEVAAADDAEREYDEPLVMSPSVQINSFIGVMLISRRLDLYNPKIVRLIRFAFIAYVVIMQIFLAFVRIKAKLDNDRTPITMENPLSGLVNSQLKQGDMVKNLASSFLTTQSTVVEYDLKQARNMNGSLLFNLALMWFLHFKMNQTQPLLIQAIQGTVAMVYNPLFQVYCMGKNLQRPFKTTASPKPGTTDTKAEDTVESTPETTKGADDEDGQEDDNDDEDDDKDEDAEDEDEDAEDDEKDK